MKLPELIFGNEKAYLHTQKRVAKFFRDHENDLINVVNEAVKIKKTYTCLEFFCHDYTGPICSECLEPCCVNRHGFPDFEDLVIFQAMGIKAPCFDCDVVDTEPCQFLGPEGCILPRYQRSYRCTWYFCDYCMDEFQHAKEKEFIRFQALMAKLSRRRIVFLEQFEREWIRYHH